MHPADALLAGIPKMLTSILTFVIKIMTRVLQLFIMPNNSVTVLTFIGKWKPNSGYTGYSTNNQFVVES